MDCWHATGTVGGIGTFAIGLLRTVQAVPRLLESYDIELDLLYPHPPGLTSCYIQPSRRLRCSFRERLFCSREHWEDYFLPKLLHDCHPDMIFSPSFRTPLTVDLPSVVTSHDVIFETSVDSGVRAPQSLQIHRQRAGESARKASMVVTPSNHARSDIIRAWSIPSERIRTIPLAPSPLFRPRNKARAGETVRFLYGVSNRFVLYYGGMNPRKNVAALVRAFEGLARRFSDLSLVLVGASDNKEAQAQVASLGELSCRVCCLSYVPEVDLALLASAAEVFVYPSLYEGFGLPPLEAMAAGTPVVTTSCTSIPEVCGDAAAYVDAVDTDALEEVVANVLSSEELQGSLRVKGLRRAAEYSWTRTTEAYLQTFMEALS